MALPPSYRAFTLVCATLFLACGPKLSVDVDGGAGGGDGSEVDGGGAGGGAGGGGAGGGAGGGGAGGGAGGGGASNQRPVFGALSAVTLAEGATQTVTLVATDPENDVLTYSLVSAHPYVQLAGDTLTISPDFSVVSGTATSITATIAVRVVDEFGSADGSIALTVNATNRAPVLASLAPVTLFAGQMQTVTVAAADADGDAVTVSLDAAAPAWATLSGSTLTLSPPAGTQVSQQLMLTATDGQLSHTLSFTANVALGQITGALTINAGAASTNVGGVTLALTASSTGGAVTQMRLSNDGANFTAFETFAASRAWALDVAADGMKTVTVELKDASGATQTGTASILFDTVAPTVNSFQLNGGAALTNSAQVQLSYTATDTGGSGVSVVGASNDGVNFTGVGASPVSWTLAAGEGIQTVTLQVFDGAGNVRTLTVQITVDTIAPTISGFSVNGGNGFTNTLTAQLSWTADDVGGSGVATAAASNDGSAFSVVGASPATFSLAATDGARTVTLRVTDLAGNAATATDRIFLDRAAPVVSSATAGGAAYTRSSSVNIVASATDAAASSGLTQLCVQGDVAGGAQCVAWSASGASFILSSGQGLKTIQVEVIDAALNTSAAVPVTITYDSIAPTIDSFSINSGAAQTNDRAVTLSYAASDTGGSGVNEVRAANETSSSSAVGTSPASWSLSAADGVRSVTLTVTDLAGNSRSSTQQILLDTVAPSITAVTLNGGAAFTNGASVSLSVTAADSGGSGVATVAASNDGITFTTLGSNPATWGLTPGEGLRTVYVRATDAAGNASNSTAQITVDTTGPTLSSFQINAGASTTRTAAVQLTFTAADVGGSGVASLRASNDGSAFTAIGASPAAWSLAAPDGLKTVTLEATDAAGNVATATAQITLDADGPAITGFQINGGAEGTQTTGATLTFSVTDLGGSGVADVAASNDGVSFASVGAAPVSWSLTSGDGVKTVTLRAIDGVGNSSTATATIFLDATAPVLSSAAINAGATYATTFTVSVTAPATDAAPSSGLFQICATGDVVPAASCLPWSASGASFTLTPGDGLKQLQVTVSDRAGNVSAVVPAQITVDSTRPVVSSMTINGGAVATNNLALAFDIVAADGAPGSGLDQMQFSTDQVTWTALQTFASSLTRTVPAGDGTRTYWVRVTDAAGNMSATPNVSATIKIDQTPPTFPFVSINGGAPGTRDPNVTVSLSANDPVAGVAKVCVLSGPTPFNPPTPAANDSCFVPYVFSMPLLLNATVDGNVRVLAWFIDAAGNYRTSPGADDIVLDRVAPSAPTGLTVSSVQYRTLTLSFTPAVDAAPSSSITGYHVYYRVQGTTAYTRYPTALTASGGTVILTAANSYELYLEATDGAGNVSAPSNVAIGASYFPWDRSNRMPTSQPLDSAGVIGGSYLVVGSTNAGADGPESFIDNGDGFATVTRLDSALRTIAPVGATGRGLFVQTFGARYTPDLGRNFYPVTFTAFQSSFLYAAAHTSTATVNGNRVEKFVIGGSNGSVFQGSVVTPPGGTPSAVFSKVNTPMIPTNANVGYVVPCPACAPGVAVANAGGTILRSIDDGLNWTAVTLPSGGGTPGMLVELPGTMTIFLGMSNGLLRSDDGGATFTRLTAFGTSNASLIAVGGDATGFTLWSYSSGTLFKFDGVTRSSVSFTVSPAPAVSAMAAVGFGPAAKLALAGNRGSLVSLTNGGATQTRKTSGTTSMIWDIALAEGSAEDAIMLPWEQNAYVTSNHGLSWTAEPLPSPQSMRTLHVFADKSAVAAGGGGVISLRSSAGAWSTISAGTTYWMNRIACEAGAGCLIAGDANTVLRYDSSAGTIATLLPSTAGSTNYGAVDQWRDSSGVVHGVVAGGFKFRTCTDCDSAGTFSPEAVLIPPQPSASPSIYAVAGKSNGRVIAVGQQGGSSFSQMWISSDHGVSWATLSGGGGFGLRAVTNVPGTSTWYAAGDRSMIRSTNDGLTWVSTPSYTYFDARGLTAALRSTGGISVMTGGNDGAVLYSSTGGL